MYQGRIKTPFDLIKQPWLDFERSLSFVLYLFLKRVLTARNRPVVVNKILLIRRNRLGDAVNVLPLIQGIKQFHPQVKIHVLASRYNAAIFRCCPHVDKVHSIDEKWLLGKATLFMHPVVLDLRHESFDLVIGLGGYSSVLAQLVLWVKGKFTVGMLSKKGTFYDLAFDRGVTELGTADKHHVEDMAHIVRTAGLLLPDRLPDSRMLSNSSVKRENWLAICPDVKRVESRYPITKYADVIEQLLRGNEVEKIILFTENSKSPYLELEKYGAQCCPTSNVEEFIQKVSQCHWAITAEGGSAHIAGALGLGVIVLSGMGHKAYWRPYSKHVRILEKKGAIHAIQVSEIVSEFVDLKKTMKDCA